MNVAVLSDIHANLVGLDAVLADIDRRGGVDQFVVLGDVVAQGYAPAATVERLVDLAHVTVVRGNTDRWVATFDWADGVATYTGRPVDESAVFNEPSPELFPAVFTYAAGLAWTHGCLAATGWMPWLASLPEQHRFILPDGTRVLASHTPHGDLGPEILASTPDHEARAILHDCEADLLLVGDSHRTLDRRVGNTHVVNPGCIGNPLTTDGASAVATYAVIEATATSYAVVQRAVALDREAIRAAIHASGFLPNPRWLKAKYGIT